MDNGDNQDRWWKLSKLYWAAGEKAGHHLNWRMVKMCVSFCSTNLVRPCGVRVGAESG